MDEADAEAVELPIDGTLDLHTFKPADIGNLVPDYLEACLERGIFDVRIVHAVLERLATVESFKLAGEGGGGWGATLVQLSQPESRKSGE